MTCLDRQDTFTIIIRPPVDVLKLNNTCSATNDHIVLPTFYVQNSRYEINDAVLDVKDRVKFNKQFHLARFV